MINLKIPLIAVAITGAIGGIVSVAYLKSQPNNLKEELLGKGKQLLDFVGDKDDLIWTNLIEKHKAPTVTIPTIEKITGLTLESDDGIATFKTKCKEIIEKSLTDKEIDKHRKDAENWCIKDAKALG